MSITIATGTAVAIASTYGTAVTMSALTNASEAVATLAVGHGVVVGDFIEITSGWDLLNLRIARVKTVATNDVTLEAINTTDTTKYPAGTGVGTIRRITAWQTVGQIQSIGTGGGEQQFTDITTITDRVQKQAPTTRNATSITLTVFDDPTLAYYATAISAMESAAYIGLRIVFPNNSRIVSNNYISVQKTPQVNANQPLTADISFSSVAEPVRYST